jgi:branched-chain amino acid transport system substrate-binding protein
MKNTTLVARSLFTILFTVLGTLSLSLTAAPKVLKVGVFQPMSGPTATFGQETMKGFEMAVNEINNKGEVKIDFILEDDKSDVTDAANAVKKLINVDKVHFLVGSVPSSNTNAAAPIAQQAGVPLLTSASTNVSVTQKGEFISRICFIDDFQGLGMAKFASESLKAKKAAIMVDSASDYSQGLAKSFKDSFVKLGGEVVAEVSYTAKDQDFSSQLTRIRARKPDVIFVPGYYQEVGNILRQAKTQGIKVPFLGGDGWSSPELPKLAGAAIDGHFYADHFSPDDQDPKVKEFVSKYKKLYGETPSAMGALGYDAAYVVADAFKRSGYKTDGKSLAKAVNSTAGFVGVTGKITLDENRNAHKPLVILQTTKDSYMSFKQRIDP